MQYYWVLCENSSLFWRTVVSRNFSHTFICYSIKNLIFCYSIITWQFCRFSQPCHSVTSHAIFKFMAWLYCPNVSAYLHVERKNAYQNSNKNDFYNAQKMAKFGPRTWERKEKGKKKDKKQSFSRTFSSPDITTSLFNRSTCNLACVFLDRFP